MTRRGSDGTSIPQNLTERRTVGKIVGWL